MRGLLLICDACRRTAVFDCARGNLRPARYAAARRGWTHNRAPDEIMRVWLCPTCSADKAAAERLRKRMSEDDGETL